MQHKKRMNDHSPLGDRGGSSQRSEEWQSGDEFWRWRLGSRGPWRPFWAETLAAPNWTNQLAVPSTTHLLRLQVEPPKEPTKEDIDRMAKEMGMSWEPQCPKRLEDFALEIANKTGLVHEPGLIFWCHFFLTRSCFGEFFAVLTFSYHLCVCVYGCWLRLNVKSAPAASPIKNTDSPKKAGNWNFCRRDLGFGAYPMDRSMSGFKTCYKFIQSSMVTDTHPIFALFKSPFLSLKPQALLTKTVFVFCSPNRHETP